MPKFCLIFIVFSFLIPFVVSANVLINEIAWMGTEESYNNEWLELYNPTDLNISLEGWVLKAVDGTPEIKFSGTIPSFSFYLLERSSDNTIPAVTANQIYTGALNNNGEKLELFDNLGNLIDSIDCSKGWLAGDNQTKKTIERASSGIWQTSQNPGGTPGAENSKSVLLAKPSVPPVSISSSAATAAEEEILPETGSRVTEIYPSGIIINEVLPSPEGPDKSEEWLELKNLNNQTIDISGWKIQDMIGSVKTYTFPENTKISALGFLVVESSISKITLNNSEDGLKLLTPNNEVVDEIKYKKAPLNQSCNREDINCFWSPVLTPELENVPGFQSEENASQKDADSFFEASNDNKKLEGETEKQLAAASEYLPKNSKPFPIILVAILLSILSSIIILILKKRLKNFNNY